MTERSSAATASRSSSTACGGSPSATAAWPARKDTLFFASGPHDWRGVTELGVHGLIGSIRPA